MGVVNIYLLLTLVSLGTWALVSTEGIGEHDVLEFEAEQDGYGGSCKCQKNTCGCCQKIEVKKIHLNDIVCVNATYLPSAVGVQVSMSINGKVVINEKITAKDPPAICAAVPGLKKLAKACLKFSNMQYSKKEVSGCVDFLAELAHIKIAKVHIGCFKIPLPEEPTNSAITDDSGAKFREMGALLEKIILLRKLKTMEDILGQ